MAAKTQKPIGLEVIDRATGEVETFVAGDPQIAEHVARAARSCGSTAMEVYRRLQAGEQVRTCFTIRRAI